MHADIFIELQDVPPIHEGKKYLKKLFALY